MKRILSLVLVAVCVMGMAACGKGDDKNTTTTTTTTPNLTTTSNPAAMPEQTTTPVSVELKDIHEAVKAAYQDAYLPNMELDSEYIFIETSVEADMYSEAIVEVPMIGFHPDKFIAFKAAEGKADALEEALNAYRDNLINNEHQYPANVERVQASQVIRHGNYIFFILLGPLSDEFMDLDSDSRLKEAQKNMQIAVDVINGFFS